MAGKARVFGANLQHMIAKAMAGAQQQHGLLFQFFRADGLARRERVVGGHGDQKRLVIQRRHRQAGIGERLGQNSAIDFPRAQHLQKPNGEILLQHQRHLRRAPNHLAHQRGQQIRANRVDHAQSQRARQRVFAALGDFFDHRRLLQHALRLPHDLLAQRCDRHFIGAALKQLDIQLLFQLLDRDRKRGLRDKASLRRAPEMLFACKSDDVFELSEGHGMILQQKGQRRRPRQRRWRWQGPQTKSIPANGFAETP